MTQELATIQPTAIQSIAEVKNRQAAVAQLIQEVLVVDVDYGVIPGTKSKPVLLQPGAEKIALMFRLVPTYKVDRVDLPGDHREYTVTCVLVLGSGEPVGEGVAVCTTMESKYRWRSGSKKCPECGKEAIIKGKAEYGGGWLCFKKKDGCGAKFEDDDTAITGQQTGRIENPDIADVFNTVIKIAKKRAFVDAVKTASATSGLWTADLEDNASSDAGSGNRPETASKGSGKPASEPAGKGAGYDPNEVRKPVQAFIATINAATCQDDVATLWKASQDLLKKMSPAEKAATDVAKDRAKTRFAAEAAKVTKPAGKTDELAAEVDTAVALLKSATTEEGLETMAQGYVALAARCGTAGREELVGKISETLGECRRALAGDEEIKFD